MAPTGNLMPSESPAPPDLCGCGQCNVCAIVRASSGQIDPAREPEAPHPQEAKPKAEPRKAKPKSAPNLFEGIEA